RLPMVAGWDGFLPAWFTRLHPRYRTPRNSILFVGALTLAFTLAGQIGVGLQEAFQLIENAAGILYGFTYISLFAIPLFGARPRQPPAAVAQSGLRQRPRRLAALLHAVRVPHHRRRQLADLRRQDHRGPRRNESGWRADLRLRSSPVVRGSKPAVRSSSPGVR